MVAASTAAMATPPRVRVCAPPALRGVPVRAAYYRSIRAPAVRDRITARRTPVQTKHRAHFVDTGNGTKARACSSRSQEDSQRNLPPAASGRMRNDDYSRSRRRAALPLRLAGNTAWTPHTSGADDIDMIDHSGVHWENAFHTLPKLTLRTVMLSPSRIVAGNDCAFKACNRSLSPSLILTCTRIVSPGEKWGCRCAYSSGCTSSSKRSA